jgi:hypothetical protein
LGWPPAPLSAANTYPSLATSASSAASAQIYFVWDSSKGKSTGSDHLLTYKRYYNLVWELRRSNLGWPQATHSAIVSYVAQSTSSTSTASAQLYFVWGSRKGKSTGSDHLLTYKRYYNLVWELRRSNLGLPQATKSAAESYPSLATSSSSAASAQIYFVWDSSKGKSTGSDHLLTYKRYYNLVWELRRSNLGWPQATHSATIYFVAQSTSAPSAASAQ